MGRPSITPSPAARSAPYHPSSQSWRFYGCKSSFFLPQSNFSPKKKGPLWGLLGNDSWRGGIGGCHSYVPCDFQDWKRFFSSSFLLLWWKKHENPWRPLSLPRKHWVEKIGRKQLLILIFLVSSYTSCIPNSDCDSPQSSLKFPRNP